jgi:hypothetical protein
LQLCFVCFCLAVVACNCWVGWRFWWFLLAASASRSLFGGCSVGFVLVFRCSFSVSLLVKICSLPGRCLDIIGLVRFYNIDQPSIILSSGDYLFRGASNVGSCNLSVFLGMLLPNQKLVLILYSGSHGIP